MSVGVGVEVEVAWAMRWRAFLSRRVAFLRSVRWEGGGVSCRSL